MREKLCKVAKNQKTTGTGFNVWWDAKEPTLNIPYFGTQARFSDFFACLISEYMNPKGLKYAETNTGNGNSAYINASEYGMKVTTNDLGLFSYYASSVVGGNLSDSERKERLDWVAYCCALIDVMGSYNPSLPDNDEDKHKVEERKHYWIEYFSKKVIPNLYVKNYNMDLEEYLEVIEDQDVIFSDYAWPWRMAGLDGETEEYTSSVDLFRKYITGETLGFKALTRKEIVPFVLKNTEKALKKCKLFILSNQSSNYPDPETLEFALINAGYRFDRHVMYTEREDVDDLGNQAEYSEDDHNIWGETCYVIKGKL